MKCDDVSIGFAKNERLQESSKAIYVPSKSEVDLISNKKESSITIMHIRVAYKNFILKRFFGKFELVVQGAYEFFPQ